MRKKRQQGMKLKEGIVCPGKILFESFSVDMGSWSGMAYF
jgi:hypothetical protein